MSALPLSGQVAIVTGAGRLRGIGRATAVALARLGCDLVVTGTGRDPATFPDDEKAAGWRDIESTADQVRALGRRCLPLVADVSREETVARLVEETAREFGRIDILINNAASPRGPDRVPVIDLNPAVLRHVFEVKVFGSFYCVRAVAPVMIKQGRGGRIINVSSIASQINPPSSAAYASSNAAVETMTRILALELAPHGIRVNAVCPGATDTSRIDDLGRGDRWETHIRNMVPLGRAASDEELGEFIAFLCTPTASYLTGQVVNVDGGASVGGVFGPGDVGAGPAQDR